MSMDDNLKKKVWRILKAIQLLFVLLVVTLEIVQAITFNQFFRKLVAYLSSDDSDNTDYSDYPSTSDYSTGSFYYNSPILYNPSPDLIPAELYFTNTSVGKGPAVIWIFIVMGISFFGLIGYHLMFNKIWDFRKNILFIGFDGAFTLLWFTEVFTNLIWIYNEIKSPCYLMSISDYYSVIVSIYLRELKTLCEAYTASNVFGWLVLASFSVGFGFSFKVYKDANSEASTNQYNVNNIDDINNMTGILQPSQQIQTPPFQDGSSRAESLQELPQIGEPSSATR